MEQHIILETQRAYLRQIRLEDLNALTDILGDLDVMYAWGHTFSHDEIRDWINENIMRYSRDGYSYWAVILKESDQLIGVTGIIKEEADNQDYIGIGCIFNKAFWHQGYAFECANACKEYAFNTLDIHLLTAQVRPDNSRSIKVVEKLGMSVIKQFDRIYRGETVPHLLYGCINETS